MATKKQSKKAKKQTKIEANKTNAIESKVKVGTPKANKTTKTPQKEATPKTKKTINTVKIDETPIIEAATPKKRTRKLTKKEEKEKKIAMFKDAPDTPPTNLVPESVQVTEDKQCNGCPNCTCGKAEKPQEESATQAETKAPQEVKTSRSNPATTGFGIIVKAKKKFSKNDINVSKSDIGRIFCKKKDGSSFTIDMQECKDKSSEHRRMKLNAEEFNEFFRIAK